MKSSDSKQRKRGSNPLGLAILALVFEKPMHPYEMAATLRQRGKDESIRLNYGSLYTVIGSLEKAGFVSAREKERQGARPERTVYAITAEGEAELFDWMRDLVGTPVKEYPRFEAALSLLPILPPDEAKALLQDRARLLQQEVERVRRASAEASGQEGARLFLIEGEYYADMCDAERKWVLGLIRLMDTSPDFTRDWRAWHEQRNKSGGKPARPGRAKKSGGDTD